MFDSRMWKYLNCEGVSLPKFVVTLLGNTAFSQMFKKKKKAWFLNHDQFIDNIFLVSAKIWMKALGRATCLNKKELKGKCCLFYTSGTSDEASQRNWDDLDTQATIIL